MKDCHHNRWEYRFHVSLEDGAHAQKKCVECHTFKNISTDEWFRHLNELNARDNNPALAQV